jgi:hypothetical protein
VRRGGDSTSGEYDSGVPASDLVAQGLKLRAEFAGLADRIDHITELSSPGDC